MRRIDVAMLYAVPVLCAAARVSGAEEYELVVTPPAARALAEGLGEAVAAAVIEFLTTALVGEPRRVGRPLQRELSGIYSARRGTY